MMNKFNDRGFLFPYIRFFNASPQGGSMDFYIGNTLVAAGIKFGHFTSYMKAGTGVQFYKATRAGRKDDIIANISLSQNIGNVHTLCVAGKANKAEFMAIEEPDEADKNKYSHIRVCNLSPEDTSFNVYATGNMILGDIKFKETSRYMEILPGSYEFSLEESKKRVPFSESYTMKQGRFGTLYIIGLLNEPPHITEEFAIDAASYDGFYL